MQRGHAGIASGIDDPRLSFCWWKKLSNKLWRIRIAPLAKRWRPAFTKAGAKKKIALNAAAARNRED
jgi:hypothetical protein